MVHESQMPLPAYLRQRGHARSASSGKADREKSISINNLSFLLGFLICLA